MHASLARRAVADDKSLTHVKTSGDLQVFEAQAATKRKKRPAGKPSCCTCSMFGDLNQLHEYEDVQRSLLNNNVAWRRQGPGFHYWICNWGWHSDIQLPPQQRIMRCHCGSRPASANTL